MYTAVEIMLMGVALRVTGHYDKTDKTFDWDKVYGLGDHGTVDLTGWVDNGFIRNDYWDGEKMRTDMLDLPTLVTDKCLAFFREKEKATKEEKHAD